MTTSDPTAVVSISNVVIPIATFIAGFAVSRFTLSKKESKDVEQANYTNTTQLIALRDEAFTRYCGALKAYAEARKANFDLFVNIATTGDVYFSQARLMADAILSEKVDVQIRDSSLVNDIKQVASKTLPDHYKTLKEIAQKEGLAYHGELRRSDHRSIFDVVDKFGTIGPES